MARDSSSDRRAAGHHPRILAQPLSNELFFITGYRLVHGGRGGDRGDAVVPAVALHPARRSHRAGTLELETVAGTRDQRADAAFAQFRGRIFLAASPACSPRASSASSDHGHRAVDASFIASSSAHSAACRGRWRGLLIGVASGLTAVFLPAASEA